MKLLMVICFMLLVGACSSNKIKSTKANTVVICDDENDCITHRIEKGDR